LHNVIPDHGPLLRLDDDCIWGADAYGLAKRRRPGETGQKTRCHQCAFHSHAPFIRARLPSGERWCRSCGSDGNGAERFAVFRPDAWSLAADSEISSEDSVTGARGAQIWVCHAMQVVGFALFLARAHACKFTVERMVRRFAAKFAVACNVHRLSRRG